MAHQEPVVNRATRSMLRLPIVGGLIRKSTCIIHYRGRSSGQEFSTPVWFRRTDTGIRIRVGTPDKKQWWKNFRTTPHPIEVEIDGTRRHGTGLVDRNESGRVVVNVTGDKSESHK